MRMRDVAIIGVGQNKHAAKRRDVNIPELISEAVDNCFAMSGTKPEQIDAVVFGNMHTFEGVNQPELWAGPLLGIVDRPVLRIATGGTTGATTAAAGYYYVASGLAAPGPGVHLWK